jgi:hypothetical protein
MNNTTTLLDAPDVAADMEMIKENLNDLFLLIMGAIILFMQVVLDQQI